MDYILVFPTYCEALSEKCELCWRLSLCHKFGWTTKSRSVKSMNDKYSVQALRTTALQLLVSVCICKHSCEETTLSSYRPFSACCHLPHMPHSCQLEVFPCTCLIFLTRPSALPVWQHVCQQIDTGEGQLTSQYNVCQS